MLVCLCLLRFLRNGSFKMGVASSLGITLVALTSPLGVFILACIALALTFSEMLLSQGRIKMVRFLTVSFLAACFGAFWYHPRFVMLITATSQGLLLSKTLLNLFPLTFFLVPLLGAFGFLLFENKPQLQPMFLAVFLTIGFGLLSLGAGLQLSAPSRFIPILGVSVSFLAGILLAQLFDLLKRPTSFKNLAFLQQYRKLILFLSVFLFLGLFFIIFNVYGQHFREAAAADILGVEIVKKTGIWEVREQSSGLSSVFGFLISGLASTLTFYLGLRLRNKPYS
jgi:hypothetical protein